MKISTLKNTKLFQLISQFSEKEHKKLGQFIASPYFNSREEVQDLYRYLFKHRNSKKLVLSKNHLHEQLFPKLIYKDERLRLLMSQLVQLIEQFIICLLYTSPSPRDRG